MCGILGVIDRKGVDPSLLIQMRDSMAHRGPDDSGLWINHNRTVGLAHRRLSIIDLSEAGKQPMSDNKGDVWITFNGEIYNFPEIRDELKKKGYLFKSQTDTEVILYAYQEWGTDCLKRLNGMFAFGIYDEKKKLLFLARDRVGKKPLYYTLSQEGLTFASELKALLIDKKISREIDLQALNHYLTFGYIGGDLCIFKNIRKLLPAHALTYETQSGKTNIWKYWDLTGILEENFSEDELLQELEERLEDAIRIRLKSDVPLGVFLSGGIDSSLVVAILSRITTEPVKTFSVGFEENRYNELPYARIVANHFKTDHHEIMVRLDSFSELPKLIEQFDEPFADSSMIPTYYISKVTRNYVKVALSGDGGDELFGGYKSYLGTLIHHHIANRIPLAFREGLAKLAKWVPKKIKERQQLLRLPYDSYGAFIDRSIFKFFDGVSRQSLLEDDILSSLNSSFWEPEHSIRNLIEHAHQNLIQAMTYVDFKTYLPDDILVKVDRASMFVSLEVRSPLLDYRIAEFSFKKISGHLKVKGITSKYFLKRLAKRVLPGQLPLNRKWGFSIPINDWFREPLFSQIKDRLLEDPNIFFRKSYIRQLLKEHQLGIDHSGRLFILLVFSLWRERFC